MFYRIGGPGARHFKEVRHPISNDIFISYMSINTRAGVTIILMIRVFPRSMYRVGGWRNNLNIFSVFVSNIVLHSTGGKYVYAVLLFGYFAIIPARRVFYFVSIRRCLLAFLQLLDKFH